MVITPSLPILCVSDAHLGAENQKYGNVEQNLLTLFKWAKKYQYHIILLGDFFDYWIDTDTYVPTIGKRILSFFEQYHKNQNKKSIYLLGNHDYWTSGYFKKIGFEVISYGFLAWNGKKILLMHGDGIFDSTFQIHYPILNRIIYSSVTKSILRFCLKDEHILAIMRLYSHGLTEFSSSAIKKTIFNNAKKMIKGRLTKFSSSAKKKTILNNAKKMIEVSNIDGVLFGHTHIPFMKRYSNGFLANPGAFYKDNTVLILNQEKIGLWKWNSSQQKMYPYSHQKFRSLFKPN